VVSSSVWQFPAPLLQNRKVILADEPTGNLDSANGERSDEASFPAQRGRNDYRHGNTFTYDANYAHRIVNLFDGKVVTENIKEHFHV